MPARKTRHQKISPKRHKNRVVLKVLAALTFTAILCLLGYLLTNYILDRRARFTRYPGFGISIPTDFSIYGIDVSHHQGHIAWDAVREMREGRIRLGFAFIKATEGIRLKDSRFDRNWRSARQNGISRGAYHYFLPDKNASQQAAHFIQQVKLRSGDLPPVLDVEETRGMPPATIRKRVREWLNIVSKHYGVKPIIYASPSFYHRVLGSEFNDHQLWVAHYVRRNQPRIGRNWSLWQFSESGRVNGIRSRVDFNVFRGDSTEFRKLLIP
jgi:lysozyme